MPDPGKQALRTKIALLKKGHSPEALKEKSERIKQLLFQTTEFKASNTILFYASLSGEVQTKGMIEHALSIGKRVALPKISGERMSLHKISTWDELEKNGMGIPEPKANSREIPLKEIDLILLPGIAFDRTGNRLGRGKGYYDRLLSEADKKVSKIAAAFSFQIVDSVPTATNDRKIHKIITEDGIIECEKGPQDDREGK